jgi:hypothetical protein
MRVLGLALTLLSAQALQPPILLEVRVFNGGEEVTAETRVTVHRAGERAQPLAPLELRDGAKSITLAPGIYDVQTIRERDGRVVSIRWAERLVVMPYPDEAGRHLEVINFTNGFGALQVRARDAGRLRDVSIYPAGQHTKPAGSVVAGSGYVLFVLPAGTYDLATRGGGGQLAWHENIEVPLDRTRLWILP